MSSPDHKANLLLIVKILAFVLFISTRYQVNKANDLIQKTAIRRNELYLVVNGQCQSDLQEFCEFPLTRLDDIGASELDLEAGDKHTVPVQETRTVIAVTPTKLPAASEETSISKLLFPLECLKTARIEQRVTPACSFALDQLQSVSELQHQQELNRVPALWVFKTSWTFFFFTGLFFLLPGLWT